MNDEVNSLPETEENSPSTDDAAPPIQEGGMSGALEAENRQLRLELIGTRLGIPRDVAEDIMLIAERKSAERGVSAEECAEEVWKRFSAHISTAPKEMTTGVHIKNSHLSDDRLRAAFGLKTK